MSTPLESPLHGNRAIPGSWLNVLGVLVASGGLLLASWRLGVSASEGLRAISILALAVLPLGFRLTRGTHLSAADRAIVSALVGYPISAATYYLLALLGLESLFPALVLGLLVEAAVRGFSRPRTTRAPALNGSVLALWAAIAFLGFSDRQPFEAGSEGMVYRLLHRDDLIHQAFYWELLRDIPPKELPTLAGFTFPPYHVFPYMMGVLLARYGRLDVPVIHHAIVPVLHVTLFFAAVYLALRTRTRSPRIAAASLILLFFTSKGLARFSHWSATAFDLFPLSESVSGGLVVWATVFCLLALSESGPERGVATRRLLMLSAVIAGLAVFFKAQLFALLGPAYVLGLLLLAWTRRSREMLAAALLACATTALVTASWRAPTRYGQVAFEPGRIAREKGHGKVVDMVPLRYRWISGTALAWWDLANFPVILPFYLAGRMRALRTVNVGDATLAFALAGSVVMVGGVTVSENYGGQSTLATLQAMESFWPWLTLGEAALVGTWLRRRSDHGERWVLFGALALALAFGPSLVRSQPGRLNLTAGEVGALAYLRERTPPDSVVAHIREGLEQSNWLNRYPVVAGLAGRRTVLEYYAWQADPESNRRRAMRNLFTTTDEAQARKILRRYRVNYVLEYLALPLKLKSEALRLVYDGGDVRLYEVTGSETPVPRVEPDAEQSLDSPSARKVVHPRTAPTATR